MEGNHNGTSMLAEEIDVKKVVYRFLKAWPLFGISIFGWLFLAIVFVSAYPPVFEAQTSIEIKEPQRIDDPNRVILGAQRFNEPDKYYFVNEQVKLRSYPLIKAVIKQLDLQVSYIQRGRFNTELYTQSPIEVVLDTNMSMDASETPYNVPFYINIIDGVSYRLNVDDKYESTGAPVYLEGIFQFGKWVEVDATRFKIKLKNATHAFNTALTQHAYGFVLNNTDELAFDIMEDLEIQPAELEASVFDIKLQGSPASKIRDFVHALGQQYIANHLAEKNATADRTIAHIDTELNKIMLALETHEQAVKSYKTGKGITNLGQSGKLLLEQTAGLEKEQVNLEIKQQYCTYLQDFLNRESVSEKIVSPHAFGIDDPLLYDMINNLIELQLEKNALVSEGKASHPAFAQIENKIVQHKSNILQMVTNFSTGNEIRIKGIKNQILSLENDAALLPATELELLRLERLYALNESQYKNLMAKKMDAEITKAASEADVQTIAAAYITSIDPVFPNFPIMMVLALLLGLLTPVGWLIVRRLLNRTLQSFAELRQLPGVPKKAMSFSYTNIRNPEALKQYPCSQTCEQLKQLQLQHESGEEPAIWALHSCNRGAGTSFVSRHLATLFALQQKKTLLLHLSQVRPEKKPKTDEYAPSAALPALHIHVPDDPGMFHTLDTLQKELEEYTNEYEVVVVDLPPLPTSAIAMKVLQMAHVNLLVTRRKQTTYEDLKTVSDQVQTSGNTLNGVVFNHDVTQTGIRKRSFGRYQNKPGTFWYHVRLLLHNV